MSGFEVDLRGRVGRIDIRSADIDGGSPTSYIGDGCGVAQLLHLADFRHDALPLILLLVPQE